MSNNRGNITLLFLGFVFLIVAGVIIAALFVPGGKGLSKYALNAYGLMSSPEPFTLLPDKDNIVLLGSLKSMNPQQMKYMRDQIKYAVSPMRLALLDQHEKRKNLKSLGVVLPPKKTEVDPGNAYEKMMSNLDKLVNAGNWQFLIGLGADKSFQFSPDLKNSPKQALNQLDFFSISRVQGQGSIPITLFDGPSIKSFLKFTAKLNSKLTEEEYNEFAKKIDQLNIKSLWHKGIPYFDISHQAVPQLNVYLTVFGNNTIVFSTKQQTFRKMADQYIEFKSNRYTESYVQSGYLQAGWLKVFVDNGLSATPPQYKMMAQMFVGELSTVEFGGNLTDKLNFFLQGQFTNSEAANKTNMMLKPMLDAQMAKSQTKGEFAQYLKSVFKYDVSGSSLRAEINFEVNKIRDFAFKNLTKVQREASLNAKTIAAISKFAKSQNLVKYDLDVESSKKMKLFTPKVDLKWSHVRLPASLKVTLPEEAGAPVMAVVGLKCPNHKVVIEPAAGITEKALQPLVSQWLWAKKQGPLFVQDNQLKAISIKAPNYKIYHLNFSLKEFSKPVEKPIAGMGLPQKLPDKESPKFGQPRSLSGLKPSVNCNFEFTPFVLAKPGQAPVSGKEMAGAETPNKNEAIEP